MTTPPSPVGISRARKAAGWVKGTAGKAFIVMMLALLPLAIATMTSNLYSILATEQERQKILEGVTRQNASQLSTTINTILTAQSLTTNVMAGNPPDSAICGRLQQLFRAFSDEEGLYFALFRQDGTALCHSQRGFALLQDIRQTAPAGQDIMLIPDKNGLLMKVTSQNRAVEAFTFYLRPALTELTSDESFGQDQSVLLHQNDASLILTGNARNSVSDDHRLSARIDIKTQDGQDSGLALETRLPDRRSNDAQTLSLFMPIVLWLAAVVLGWLVMRWLLIKPLMSLRREVAAYEPGHIIQPPRISRLASSEIVDLGESFQKMSQQVITHEESMSAALDRQTRLTREVHHRVKNNLQVISSLISLHWRAADDPKEAEAYLSIQRRVDALAVVQRNYYADADEIMGLRARPMMNEIASALKISAKLQSGRNIDIAVDCDDISLHQDIATAVAFMTAELADLFLSLDPTGQFTISLRRTEEDPMRAKLALAAPIFRQTACRSREKCQQEQETVALSEKVLAGLARQLRSPLDHDVERGEYHVVIPITGSSEKASEG